MEITNSNSCSAANTGGAATSLNRSGVDVFTATVAPASHVKPKQRLILALNIAAGRMEPRVTQAFNCNLFVIFLVSLNDKRHRLVVFFPLMPPDVLEKLLLHNCRCRTGLRPAGGPKRAADEREAEARSIFGCVIYRRLNV